VAPAIAIPGFAGNNRGCIRNDIAKNNFILLILRQYRLTKAKNKQRQQYPFHRFFRHGYMKYGS
jgi:hypothetical protein